MLNRKEDGLEIFDNFVVDALLLKFKDDSPATSNDDENRWSVEGVEGSVNIVRKVPKKKGFLKRLFGPKEPKPLSIDNFFKSIKNSKEELDVIDKRLEGYKAALVNAEHFGQTALAEELLERIDVVRAESQLYAHGHVNVIREEHVVKLYKETQKGMSLTWMVNFGRPIPNEFLEIKRALDEVGVFDNYCVLHYDANKKSYLKTKAEIELEKDPILFGVIKNSRKLYYIGDWIDEYCDLTLDAFFDKFGEEAIKKNNLTAEVDLRMLD